MNAITSPTTQMTESLRIGVVSFLNTLPLVDGLAGLRGLDIRQTVPSLLVDQLVSRQADVALCSSIDYQRSPEPLRMLRCGMLGCDGTTMTVRLYSQSPIAEMRRVYCDRDSHTSVALMSILLSERYGIQPELIDYDAREHVADNRPIEWPDAVLLIGDKVVTDSPPAVRYPHQMDLGYEWREITGLPFVFACWMARADTDRQAVQVASAALDRQRRHNTERIDLMIHEQAQKRGWPKDLAKRYLKQHLLYDLDDRAIAGLQLFFDKAHERGLIRDHRPITFVD